YGPAANAPSYFYLTLFGGNYTVASRYQGRIFLVEPGQAPQQVGALLTWIVDALSANGYTLTGTTQQVLQNLPYYLPIVIHFKGGQISSVQVLRALGTATG
ncbi:MAG: hypothetical protein JZD41_00690, partial [Thermoproteus sp.]|nr:hypothetical protein [Thermoproteus sp.]